MRIGILKQGVFGGTDELLDRAMTWFSENGYDCDPITESFHGQHFYDCILLPTSEISRLGRYYLRGLRFKKLLVWSMGHGAFGAAFYNRKFETSFMKFFLRVFPALYLRKLFRLHAIVFTDLVGLNYELYTTGYNRKLLSPESLIVPIAIKGRGRPIIECGKSQNRLVVNCCWIGRVSHDFKVEPLLDLLKELNQLMGEDLSVKTFYVIGSGDAISYLRTEVKLMNLRFAIRFIDFIPPGKLDNFMNQHVDLSFVMGTAALDSSKMCIPTIVVKPYSILDKSHGKVNHREKYRFVFNSKGFSLGEFPDLNVIPSQPDSDLQDIMDYLKEQGVYNVSIKCRKYSEKFFEDEVFSKLVRKLKGAKDYEKTFLDYFLLIFFISKAFLKRLMVFCGSR
ncbi:hypothetical protein FDP08_05820 [Marinobacter panjinensis]|uniref:Glycosyltransferase n=1 Tax=Marinobacter panjinensis TaxID=2576384 RepID=A0A4U6R5Q7_9GAMM|nr:hypothetical protein [Marinobacter panjinensis]MCR8913714.1 hypothetical protein [Marinobacter panjinensis]TKV67636.1 hypothetical protein FDP08_05820 [Marinobacter panjinensis]